jgi:hypothetical protein
VQKPSDAVPKSFFRPKKLKSADARANSAAAPGNFIGDTDATPTRKLKSVWAASAAAADLLWRRLRIGQRW